MKKITSDGHIALVVPNHVEIDKGTLLEISSALLSDNLDLEAIFFKSSISSILSIISSQEADGKCSWIVSWLILEEKTASLASLACPA